MHHFPLNDLLGFVVLKRICIFMTFFLVILLKPMTSHSQDHPLLSGMSGFEIKSRDVVEYDSYNSYKGDIFSCDEKRRCTSKDHIGFNEKGELVAEGRITSIKYSSSRKGDKKSALAIFRNYENAIKNLGGKFVSKVDGGYYPGCHAFFLEKNAKNVWIVLCIEALASGYQLIFVEESTLEHSVKTGSLEEDIANKGYATLYINFDHNKSEIKSDGKPIVDEVSALLKRMPGLRLSIEGHTDDVGDADANQKLSQARARSVVDALVATGIDAKRLQSKGWGSAKPIADNRLDDGRARNRRVELVRLK